MGNYLWFNNFHFFNWFIIKPSSGNYFCLLSFLIIQPIFCRVLIYSCLLSQLICWVIIFFFHVCGFISTAMNLFGRILVFTSCRGILFGFAIFIFLWKQFHSKKITKLTSWNRWIGIVKKKWKTQCSTIPSWNFRLFPSLKFWQVLYSRYLETVKAIRT